MSDKVEQTIQEWYSNSRTKRLEYLDLAEVSQPTISNIANNIGVLNQRLSLVSKVILKHFYSLEEENRFLRKEVAQLKLSLQQLEDDQIRHRPLSKLELQLLFQQALAQPLAEIRSIKTSLSRTEQLVEKIKKSVG